MWKSKWGPTKARDDLASLPPGLRAASKEHLAGSFQQTALTFTGASNHLDFILDSSSALFPGVYKVNLDLLFLLSLPSSSPINLTVKSMTRSRSKASQGQGGHRTQRAVRKWPADRRGTVDRKEGDSGTAGPEGSCDRLLTTHFTEEKLEASMEAAYPEGSLPQKDPAASQMSSDR